MDTEDPQFGADYPSNKIERFVSCDGSAYMEVDLGVRLSEPELQEMYDQLKNNFAMYCK